MPSVENDDFVGMVDKIEGKISTMFFVKYHILLKFLNGFFLATDIVDPTVYSSNRFI